MRCQLLRAAVCVRSYDYIHSCVPIDNIEFNILFLCIFVHSQGCMQYFIVVLVDATTSCHTTATLTH